MPDASYLIAASSPMAIPLAFIKHPKAPNLQILYKPHELPSLICKFSDTVFINMVNPALHMIVTYLADILDWLSDLPGLPKLTLPVR